MIGVDADDDTVVIVSDVVELLSDATDVWLSVGGVVISMLVVLDPYVVVEIVDGDAYCVDPGVVVVDVIGAVVVAAVDSGDRNAVMNVD